MIGLRAGLALVAVAIASAAMAQGSTTDEIAKYRAALQDGNPAELWEIRGEALWKEPRGPKHASLEGCDLGLGPGVVKGAYAGLPRYFADTDRVLDLESRLVGCMVKLQGFTEAEAQKNPFGNGNAARSDLEALKALGAVEPAQSTDIVFAQTPEIAENGAVVPIGVVSNIAKTQSIAILIEKNPNPLAAVFDIPPGTEPALSTRVKMAQTSKVYALVKADGKSYVATKEIKVTLGGCGG